MELVLIIIKELRARVERGERKAKRVLIAGRIHIVEEDENGTRFATGLKDRWEIK